MSPLAHALLLALPFVLAPHVAAQGARWQIPDGGLLRYAATEKWTCTNREEPHQRAAPPHHRLPHTTLLLADELTADHRTTAVHVIDPRWLAPRLAFDLTTLGPARDIAFTIDELVPFTPVRIVGKADAMTPEGRQTLTLRIERAAPKKVKADDHERMARQLVLDCSCTGTLVIDRRFDAARGVIAEFSADLVLQCDNSARYPVRQTEYHLQQTWTLRDVMTRRQSGFDLRVAEAIRRGAAHVRTSLAIPDRDQLRPSTERTDGEGYLALGLLTLLHAEVPANDAVVRQGFDELRRRVVRQTYPLSLALLAIERLHAPPGERDKLLAGTLKRPLPRVLAGDDLAAAREWTKALLDNRDHDVRPEYETRWSYGDRGFDNSNSQYGVLGLHSAELCGIEVGRTTWFAVAAHWLDQQCPAEGPSVPITLRPLQATKVEAPAGRTQAQQRGVPRGWDYGGGNGTPYGSMTAAGIASLTIALAHLQDADGKVAEDLRTRIEQAIRDGFTWLAKWSAPRQVPGPSVGSASNWYFYWLYGLERACELSNVGLIDGVDWYHDHAMLLLESQWDDGSWGTLEDTCWAILFLKKAQLPVFTRPR